MGPRGGRPSTPRATSGRGNHSAAHARAALVLLLGGVLTPLVAAGLRGVLWALVSIAGLALAAAGVWWALAYTGTVRTIGTALSMAAPATVLTLYATAGLLGPALLSAGLLVLAVITARRALAPAPTQETPAAPHHPWVLMNRQSGGGKVDRFRLADKARAAGCRVHVLVPGQDVTALARQAIADGADLLGVAGGDGTQALVADVAAHHDVPFVVVPAATRNHFALDLGLDRDDPVAALEALTGGIEFRTDLGYAADRVFVNNASFGTYACVVNDPAYRTAKARTVWQALPALLTGDNTPALRMTADGRRLTGLQALLVSNNQRYWTPPGPPLPRCTRWRSRTPPVMAGTSASSTATARSASPSRPPIWRRPTADSSSVGTCPWQRRWAVTGNG
ncbi:diacylglycerol kinase family protein [Streptomyces microflavus]|uniref:diacylglycerol/lipid kinase family protein n=1 Tax=Streptomyces microflavus TaxID=1919 RepID=UPI0034237E75